MQNPESFRALCKASAPGASTNGFDGLRRRRGAGRAPSPHPELGTMILQSLNYKSQEV